MAAACSAAARAASSSSGQLVEPAPQLVDQLLQLDDPLDAGQVDALLLGEPLHLAQQRDVAGRVAPPAAGRPAGADEPQPVVAAQRLGVQAGELRGHRDDEDRAVRAGARRQAAAVLTRCPSVTRAPPQQVGPRVEAPWWPRRRTAARCSPRRPALRHRHLHGDQQVARVRLARPRRARAPGTCARWWCPRGSSATPWRRAWARSSVVPSTSSG